MANKLYVHSTPLEDLVEIKKTNDTRKAHDINGPYNVTDFIAPATGYAYDQSIAYPFNVNGQKSRFPLKGTRPQFTLRESTLLKPGVFGMATLTKNANNQVVFSGTDSTGAAISHILNPDGAYVNTIFLLLQGAGGGGGGNNITCSGAGGGAGGTVLLAIDLEHPADEYFDENTITFWVGEGGSAGYNPTSGTIVDGAAGGNTVLGWYSGGYRTLLGAYGGNGGTSSNGANSGNGGAGGGYSITNIDKVPYVHFVWGREGNFGLAGGANKNPDGSSHGNNATNTIEAVSTGRQTPDDIDYEHTFPASSVTASGYGGNGGCSIFGAGGQGSGTGGNGAIGAGGGGANNNLTKRNYGGTGGQGHYLIYF